MLKEKDRVIRTVTMVLDAFLVTCTFILTFFLRKHFFAFYKFDFIPSAHVIKDISAVPLSAYIVVLFFAVPLWCFMLYLNGMYHSMRTKTLLEIIWIIIKSVFLFTLAFGAIVFISHLEFVSRLFFTIFVAASSVCILVEKLAIFSIAHYVRRQGYNYRQLLIVGTGRRAAAFINKINIHPEWGMKISGVVDYEHEQLGRDIEGIKVSGTLDDIQKILHDEPIDEVVFIVPRAKLSHIENSLYVCETEGVKTTIAADLFDLKIARLRQTELDGMPLLTFETTLTDEWQHFLKRTLDMVVSGMGLIALSPLLLAVAVLIKLTSQGPVFYKSKRIGLNGRKFVFYKFRSMYKGAHLKQEELMGLNEAKGPVFKIKKDPRVTPLGRVLRKFSIDELPQLFNVFVGHMSLVGPRPPLPKEIAKYEPWQRRRLSMRPGITCLWQISGRSKIGFDEWMRLDLEYIDNWSLWLDFKIFMKTIPVVIFGVGAY
ncbi:MAG: UDP-phosphate galactose phosphotransferase [Candidatus Omnitrophica bacterium CG1_02_49_10]|nr:MAG: UDP-phosphate galactose phosphotransferase [Candidatus Omnitrophica bacterium CG1_02_49_10]